MLPDKMIKRSWAILFLFLANIVLLGHSIIPHHHVNRLPSVVPIHGHQFDKCKFEPGEFHPENHHHGSDFYHCLLNQHFLNRSNSHRVDINYLDVESSSPDLFTSYPDKYWLWNSVKKTIRFVPIHVFRTNYTDYVNRCSGLRAPPLV
jgi:hypothetical protein